MRVVLDTNVLISGIFWKGAPHDVLKAWTKGRFELVISASILTEYLAVLKRIDIEGVISERWTVYISEHAYVIKDAVIVTIARDSGDDKFINAALVAKADFLVSGDDDLLSLKNESPVTILKPREFLKVLYKIR